MYNGLVGDFVFRRFAEIGWELPSSINSFRGDKMKYLSLLTWVGQFGFSCFFPTCALLMLGVYLQNRFNLGVWVVVVLGIIGFLTSISTARACLQSMRKEIERIDGDRK